MERTGERCRPRRSVWPATPPVMLLIVAIVISACGGDDHPQPSLSTPTATATPTPTALPDAADPDFSGVTDILGGQRSLLRNDDLVVLQNFFSPEVCHLESVVLQTTDSRITHSQRAELAALGENLIGSGLDVGRMFDLPNDVVATVFTPQNSVLSYHISDPMSATVLDGAVPAAGAAEVDFAAMADFTGDGYADLVIHDRAQRMRIATAANVADMSAGLRWGDDLNAPTVECHNAVGYPCNAFAIGDFRGDGQRQIALVQPGTDDRGLKLTLFTVDPTTLAITAGDAVTLPIPDATQANLIPVIASGRFGTMLHDQLVLAYTRPAGNLVGETRAVAVDLDVNLQPTVRGTLTLGTLLGGEPPMAFVVKADRLSAAGPLAQAVVFVADDGPDAAVRILTFDERLTIMNPAALDRSDLDCGQDLAVGNFDRMKPNPQPPPTTQRDPDLQVALLSQPRCNGLGGAATFAVDVYDVDPQHDFQLSRALTFPFEPEVETVQLPRARLVAGDTQGRSLLLGPPQKVTITGHLQTDIVLGIPPMHIDFIRDVDNLGPDGHPGVLNISVMPSLPAPATGFNTEYSFSSSSSMTASRKSTTSYAFATKETVGAKISYGVPDVAGVSVEAKAAAKQTHDSTVASRYNTYSGVTDNLAATTGFADHLFFSQVRFNLYYYPVLRQTVCPAGKPNCPDNEKRPLHVVFSGPDIVTQGDIDATTQEWYQPPWEPGNVFSYPWNLALLQQAVPNLTPLTTTPAPWRGTDTSESAYSTTWTQGSGSSQSSGSVSTNSTDVSVSVAAKASIEGFGISGSAGFEVNKSQSVATVNSSAQTVSSSTGIRVNKPEFSDEVADNYLYDFGGYVFGQMPPAATVQTIPLTDAQGRPIDVQSTGPLMVGFVADPLREGLPWWQQAYTVPDVGLNHPERWDWSKSTRTASFNFATLDSPPQDQPFYHIKGLFITPADADGAGPQLVTATAGEQLQLQARVYNFSLVDMPSDAAVHVRFYGQVYDKGELQGDSFQIGEDVISPIPGFNPSTSKPNWALASTTFDTSGRSDQYLIFWVLVWMENPAGDLLPELEEHGLKANPHAMSFAQITDVPTETYSNNVGFYGYNTPFFIAAPNTLLGSAPSKPGDLAIDTIEVPSGSAQLDTKTNVRTQLHTGDASLGAFPVLYYDGDPRQGGTLFDVQLIPAIPAQSTYVSRVFMRPATAGEHTIFVVAAPGTGGAVTGSVPLTVLAP